MEAREHRAGGRGECAPAMATSPALHARSPFAVAMRSIALAAQTPPLAAAVDRRERHERRWVFGTAQPARRLRVGLRVDNAAARVTVPTAHLTLATCC